MVESVAKSSKNDATWAEVKERRKSASESIRAEREARAVGVERCEKCRQFFKVAENHPKACVYVSLTLIRVLACPDTLIASREKILDVRAIFLLPTALSRWLQSRSS